jgi:hypothetical protein
MAKVEGHAKQSGHGKPRMHPWPAPSVHSSNPRLSRGYGRKGRKAGTPKPNRSRRRSRSDNTGAAQLRMERAGGLRLLEEVPAVGISWTNGCKARELRARKTNTWRLFGPPPQASARDRHPDGPKPHSSRVRSRDSEIEPGWRRTIPRDRPRFRGEHRRAQVEHPST